MNERDDVTDSIYSTEVQDLSETAHRVILAGVALYFGLFVVAYLTGEPLVHVAAHAVFGLVAVAIGVVLYREASGAQPMVTAASGCLVGGGLAQLAWVVTGLQVLVLDLVATAAVFTGIVLYVYAAWSSS